MRKIFVLIAVMLLSHSVRAGELRGIIKNNQGVNRYDSGKPNDAYGFFTDALGDVPFAPELQYNIGDTFLQLKDLDKAISQFQLSLKLAAGNSPREREIRFRSLFNLGAIYAAQNKTDEALESYQLALDLKPDSVETITNMELLTQQGGQGGKGDKEQKDPKDGEGEGKKDQPKFSNKPSKPQAQPFKGKDLSKQDVDRILDELKQQEEQIRAKDQKDGGKDAPPDKDW